MKFDIEIVCTQQIIIDYMKLENLYNHGVLGGKPPTSKKTAFSKYKPIAMKFYIKIVCTQ